MFLLLGLSLAWALAGLLAAVLSWKLLHGERRRVVLACLLVVDAAVMFMVPQSAATRVNQIDIPAVQFLGDHQGLSRSYTLGPIAPNYGAYFRVASIDHNVVPVPKLWADYVERNLLPSSSRSDSSLPFYSSMTFWPEDLPDGEAERALSQNLDNYLNLGVRYVVTKPGQSPAPKTLSAYRRHEQSARSFGNTIRYAKTRKATRCLRTVPFHCQRSDKTRYRAPPG